jgi:hypothetical protein
MRNLISVANRFIIATVLATSIATVAPHAAHAQSSPTAVRHSVIVALAESVPDSLDAIIFTRVGRSSETVIVLPSSRASARSLLRAALFLQRAYTEDATAFYRGIRIRLRSEAAMRDLPDVEVRRAAAVVRLIRSSQPRAVAGVGRVKHRRIGLNLERGDR